MMKPLFEGYQQMKMYLYFLSQGDTEIGKHLGQRQLVHHYNLTEGTLHCITSYFAKEKLSKTGSVSCLRHVQHLVTLVLKSFHIQIN